MDASVYKKYICDGELKIGVHIPYEICDPCALIQGLKGFAVLPQNCVLFLDFTGMPFDLEGASESVAAIIEQLDACAKWGRIVFQGSSFPDTNKAKAGGDLLIKRREWDIFQAVKNDLMARSDNFAFGDFGADTGRIKFPTKKGGGPAIRHLRYTGVSLTTIFRGVETGSQRDAMMEVCKRVLASEHYAGQAFSYADDAMWQMANGLINNGGTASIWREWNMAHHMTRVVRDLGAIAGVRFRDSAISKKEVQDTLFPAK